MVRDREVHLCKNVIDYPINVFNGHSLGVLCYFDEILAKHLDTGYQHILQSHR